MCVCVGGGGSGGKGNMDGYVLRFAGRLSEGNGQRVFVVD